MLSSEDSAVANRAAELNEYLKKLINQPFVQHSLSLMSDSTQQSLKDNIDHLSDYLEEDCYYLKELTAALPYEGDIYESIRFINQQYMSIEKSHVKAHYVPRTSSDNKAFKQLNHYHPFNTNFIASLLVSSFEVASNYIELDHKDKNKDIKNALHKILTIRNIFSVLLFLPKVGSPNMRRYIEALAEAECSIITDDIPENPPSRFEYLNTLCLIGKNLFSNQQENNQPNDFVSIQATTDNEQENLQEWLDFFSTNPLFKSLGPAFTTYAVEELTRNLSLLSLNSFHMMSLSKTIIDNHRPNLIKLIIIGCKNHFIDQPEKLFEAVFNFFHSMPKFYSSKIKWLVNESSAFEKSGILISNPGITQEKLEYPIADPTNTNIQPGIRWLTNKHSWLLYTFTLKLTHVKEVKSLHKNMAQVLQSVFKETIFFQHLVKLMLYLELEAHRPELATSISRSFEDINYLDSLNKSILSILIPQLKHTSCEDQKIYDYLRSIKNIKQLDDQPENYSNLLDRPVETNQTQNSSSKKAKKLEKAENTRKNVRKNTKNDFSSHPAKPHQSLPRQHYAYFNETGPSRRFTDNNTAIQQLAQEIYALQSTYDGALYHTPQALNLIRIFLQMYIMPLNCGLIEEPSTLQNILAYLNLKRDYRQTSFQELIDYCQLFNFYNNHTIFTQYNQGYQLSHESGFSAYAIEQLNQLTAYGLCPSWKLIQENIDYINSAVPGLLENDFYHILITAFPDNIAGVYDYVFRFFNSLGSLSADMVSDLINNLKSMYSLFHQIYSANFALQAIGDSHTNDYSSPKHLEHLEHLESFIRQPGIAESLKKTERYKQLDDRLSQTAFSEGTLCFDTDLSEGFQQLFINLELSNDPKMQETVRLLSQFKSADSLRTHLTRFIEREKVINNSALRQSLSDTIRSLESSPSSITSTPSYPPCRFYHSVNQEQHYHCSYRAAGRTGEYNGDDSRGLSIYPGFPG